MEIVYEEIAREILSGDSKYDFLKHEPMLDRVRIERIYTTATGVFGRVAPKNGREAEFIVHITTLIQQGSIIPVAAECDDDGAELLRKIEIGSTRIPGYAEESAVTALV